MQGVEATPRAQQEVRLASRSAYVLFETTSRMSPTHPQGGVESSLPFGGGGRGKRRKKKTENKKEQGRKKKDDCETEKFK